MRHGYGLFCLESVDSNRCSPIDARYPKASIMCRAAVAEAASSAKLGSLSWRSSNGRPRFLSGALPSFSGSRSLALLVATPHNKPLNQTVF